ncbi:MAG: substrate-binding domain-containing protein [Eubacteriales bacterium]|nr:substrate-binding domain-containing protein [Eubacteriales bacterium]MDD4474744.1 substrate-binding domain-containing protein [Eubacteriales bacterium]
MKKLSAIIIAAVLLLAGCADKGFSKDTRISVISRESGSGTRGAFIELMGIEKKNDAGEKVDYTTKDSQETNSTGVMMTSVANNKHSIGYISLGSLNDTVKALKVDGVEPTAVNIKNGTYKVFRPFNIATKGEVSEVTQDFIDYILSKEGQAVVEGKGYLASVEGESYAGSKPEGKIVIQGSSSVTPVMEKLSEEYRKINTNAQIEINQNDSTTGMNMAISGSCDIGMASRELKQSELDAGLKNTVIALDGIAVIVNKDNTATDITSEQVMKIYIGEIKVWNEIIK